MRTRRAGALWLSLFRAGSVLEADMKDFVATLLLVVAGFAFSGCETDVPPDPNAKRGGPTGRGEIVQPDKSDDPIIRENTRVGY
jgi:hypothetical protein